jgi:hypothetical protein
MLLGFYDRNDAGLAVELSPEMAKAITTRVRELFAISNTTTIFDDASTLQLARFAFEEIYLINLRRSTNENNFFCFSGETYASEYEPTGVFIDFQNGDACVFWEYYDRNGRYTTPYLTLPQLDAIADNQPLPAEE